MVSVFPTVRFRRFRQNASLRLLVRETQLHPQDFIYPVFVEEEINDREPISTMPGVFRLPEKKLAKEVEQMAKDGIKAVLLFGISHHKDATGSDTGNPKGLMARMVRITKDVAPHLVVITDNCFCEYTTHGHCGVLNHGRVDNDATITNLAQQAVVAIEAGADMVAPSAMMDGQVLAIRRALDATGHDDAPILAYSSKFASSFYGAFRVAAGCDLEGDRFTYQMDAMNGREAIRESLEDEAEGADLLMVKPGLPYLDVLSTLRQKTLLPLVAYQVGGEYAMIKFAAAAGAINEERAVWETLGALKRAGADLIVSYFARDLVKSCSGSV